MSKLFGNLFKSLGRQSCYPYFDAPAEERRLFGVDMDRFSDNLGRAQGLLNGDYEQSDLSAFGELLRRRKKPGVPAGAMAPTFVTDEPDGSSAMRPPSFIGGYPQGRY